MAKVGTEITRQQLPPPPILNDRTVDLILFAKHSHQDRIINFTPGITYLVFSFIKKLRMLQYLAKI